MFTKSFPETSFALLPESMIEFRYMVKVPGPGMENADWVGTVISWSPTGSPPGTRKYER